MLMSTLPPLPEYALQFRPRWPGDEGGFTEAQLRAYGKACAAAEREACAKVCESFDDGSKQWSTPTWACAAAIRARGET